MKFIVIQIRRADADESKDLSPGEQPFLGLRQLVQEFRRSLKDQLRIGGGAGERDLPRMAPEFAGLHHHADGQRPDAVPLHARGHLFREMAEDRRNLFRIILRGNVFGCGCLVGIAFGRLPLAGHRTSADASGGAADVGARFFTENCLENGELCRGGVPDGPDPEGAQALCADAPAAEKGTDGQGPHFFRHLLRPEGVGLVRFFKITRHLCEELVGGDPDVHGKFQSGPDLIADALRGLQRIVPDRGICGRCPPAGGICGTGSRSGSAGKNRVFGCFRQVQEGFIDGGLLDGAAVSLKDFNKGMGKPPVGVEIRPDQNQVRTFPEGSHHRLAGFDPELFGRDRLCRDDAVARFNIAPDRGRDGAEIHCV